MRSKFLFSAVSACALPMVIVILAFAAGPNLEHLQLVGLDGRPCELWPTGQDGLVVLIFTRTDCPISNRYAPEVRRLYEKFDKEGVSFYLVYVDPREEPADIRAHLKEFEYPCPALVDHEHALAAATGATITPEAVVFDRERKQVYRGRIDDLFVDFGKSRSEATTHDLEDAIAATLAGQRVAAPVTQAAGCLISDLK